MDDKISIHCLPDEIITMVLELNDINEIVSFSLTCKRFYELLNSNQKLWKEKFKTLVPDIHDNAEKHCNGRWVDAFKGFMRMKQIIYKLLLKMSPMYYWKKEDITIHDIGHFFTIALKYNLSFYYTIYILQDLIIKADENINLQNAQKPFTLTEMYYARIILRHLIHSYLCVKWVRHQNDSLPPENVVNYFLQWMDTHNIHYMEDVEEKLQEIANMVEVHLAETYPLQLQLNKSYTVHQVFQAVSYIFFQKHCLTLTSTANLDTIDIIKIWDSKIGNKIVVFAMFQAVTRRVGVYVELIVFASHVFLEWKSNDSDQEFRVNISTGELEVKRNCPFAQWRVTARYRYSQDTLLQCLHTAYVKCMGSAERWTVTNATDLLGFLSGGGGDGCPFSPYDNFHSFLSQNVNLLELDSDLDMKFLTNKELQIIFALLRVNPVDPKPSFKTGNDYLRNLVVKKRRGNVLYAVGMICCHKIHNYVCVIQGWDHTAVPGRTSDYILEKLSRGKNQPFYDVIAVDNSQRYVAEENLVPLADPTRLNHMEEFVGKQFTHFDGFSYLLNDEKMLEYPEEPLIVDAFRRRYHTN